VKGNLVAGSGSPADRILGTKKENRQEKRSKSERNLLGMTENIRSKNIRKRGGYLSPCYRGMKTISTANMRDSWVPELGVAIESGRSEGSR